MGMQMYQHSYSRSLPPISTRIQAIVERLSGLCGNTSIGQESMISVYEDLNR